MASANLPSRRSIQINTRRLQQEVTETETGKAKVHALTHGRIMRLARVCVCEQQQIEWSTTFGLDTPGDEEF